MAKAINPYVVGNAVFAPGKFFDRTDILEWVADTLHGTHHNSLVLIGQRRIGKTSLLRRLQQVLPTDGYRPVYFDLLDEGRRPLGEVLVDLAEDITSQLGLADLAEDIANQLGQNPPPHLFDDQGRFFSRDFVPRVLNRLGEDSRLVVLFDEFEVVDPQDESELPENSAARKLQPFLRRLLVREPRVAFVFATGRSTEDLTVNIKATFRTSLRREVWVLDEPSAKELIRQAEVEGTLRFTGEGIERILSLSNCHPYLTQLLCYCIWVLSYKGVPEGQLPPPVGRREVELAVELAIETGGGALDWIWEGLSPAEKIYASALAGVSREGGALAADRIIASIEQHAPRRRDSEVVKASTDLVKRRVLKEPDDEHFAFEFELFRRWVRLEKPLRAVEGELDKLRPEAEELFLLGVRLLRKKSSDQPIDREQLRRAREYFRSALAIHPEHFKAWSELGQVYLELGARQPALDALEEAYGLNPREARLSLVNVLVQNAEELQTSHEAMALKYCNRALELSPSEVAARRIRAAIWTRCGDRAVDETEALRWYRQAQNNKKIQQLEHHRLQRRLAYEPILEAMASVVRAAKGAAKACEKPAALAAEPRPRAIWLAAARILRQEVQMVLHIKKGVEALRNQWWTVAAQSFDAVKRVLPEDDSQHAVELLPDPEAAGLEIAGDRRVGAGSAGGSDLARHARMAFDRALAYARTLEQARSEGELSRATESEKLAAESWKSARNRLWQKESSAHSYVEGIKALQRGNLDLAQRRLGWARPRPAVAAGIDEPRPVSAAQPKPSAETRISGVDAGGVFEDPAAVVEGRPMALAPDGRWLASSTGSTATTLRDLGASRATQTLKIGRSVHALAFSPDSAALAVAVGDAFVLLWSVAECKVIRKLRHTSAVCSLAFSPEGRTPEGRTLALGTEDGSIHLWRPEGRRTGLSFPAGECAVRCINFSPDGDVLAAVSGAPALWSTDDGTRVRTLPAEGGTVHALTFSPDGATLATGSTDGVVRLWELASGTCRQELAGHRRAVRAIAFQPQGHSLASASLDRTVRQWRLADGEVLNEFEPGATGVAAVAYSADGGILAWGLLDGTVRVWDTSGKDPPRRFGG